MSIRPIDFNGMIQNSTEAGTIRQHEEARPMVEQQSMAVAMEQEVQERMNQVEEANRTESGEDKMDAKDGGNGEYQDNRKKGKKKEQEKGRQQDRVIVKGQPKSFDITI